ncbi:SDA1-domain-containing protein [Lactifluus volemus]|nr:SDA1-domain-containing protein [Lactifluus volemus]
MSKFPPWTLTALRSSRIISRRYMGNTTSKTRLADNDSPSPVEVNRTSTLATTKILTPADFALISDLRIQAATQAVETGGGPAAKHKLASLSAVKKAAWSGADDTSAFVVSESNILGLRKKAKADYEDRIGSIARGREGREKFSFAERKGEEGDSEQLDESREGAQQADDDLR